MSKFFSFLRSHTGQVFFVLAMVFATIVLAATSREHGLLIAIFYSFTIIGFAANESGYKGSSIYAFVAFLLFAVLCSLSLGGSLSIVRTSKWQDNLGGFMAVMNFLIMLHSVKMMWRVLNRSIEEENKRRLGLLQKT